MKLTNLLLSGVAIAALSAGTAAADVEDPMKYATNAEWVSLTGEVVSSTGELFTLDYGDGEVIVEMDDYDNYTDNFVLRGDQVTVTGRIDNDFFETRTMEAGSVYIERLHEYIYASAADEENGYYSYLVGDYVSEDEWLGLTGTVRNVTPDEFTLDTGPTNITIDTEALPYELFIEAGDRVSVYGEFDQANLFDEREVLASSVVKLSSS